MVMAKKRCGLTALLMAGLAGTSNGDDSSYSWHFPWSSSSKAEKENEKKEEEIRYQHAHDHNVLTKQRAFCNKIFKLESLEYSCGDGKDCSWGSTVDYNITLDTGNAWVTKGADFKVFECWSRYGPCREFWHHKEDLQKYFIPTSSNERGSPYPGEYTVSQSIKLPGYAAPVYHPGNSWIRVQVDGPDGPICHVKVKVDNFFAEYGTMTVSFLSVLFLMSACAMHIQKAKHERENPRVIEMTKSQIAEAECDLETPVKARFELMQDATQEENSDWDSSVTPISNQKQSRTTNQGIRASGIKFSRTPDWDSPSLDVKQNLFNKKDPDWDQ